MGRAATRVTGRGRGSQGEDGEGQGLGQGQGRRASSCFLMNLFCLHKRLVLRLRLGLKLLSTLFSTTLPHLLPLFCVISVLVKGIRGDIANDGNQLQPQLLFVHNLNVCNSVINEKPFFLLEATGSNVTFSLDPGWKDRMVVNLDGNALRLADQVNDTRTYVFVVTAKSTVPTGSDKVESGLKFKLDISDQFCPKIDTASKYCTIVIAFLAFLCLVLLTALSLALIVLRRKHPFSLSLKKAHRESDGSLGVSPSRVEGFISPRKPSAYDSPNFSGNGAIRSLSPQEPGMSFPRKSSLKPCKSLNGNSSEVNSDSSEFPERAIVSSYYNNGYEEGDPNLDNFEDKVSEGNESPVLPGPDGPRRKSIVTFSEKTQVIRIQPNADNKP